jgi:hypothetical protein
MDKNEIKKDLYKTKAIASFSRYIAGNLYYTVDVAGNTYEFPISTVEETNGVLSLSSDLGTTEFGNSIRGSELNRWIMDAVDTGVFIKITNNVTN